MSSRWMQSMQARQRQFKKRQAASATTITETKFERRKVKINPKTGQIIGVESIEEHLERQLKESLQERSQPKEWRRVYARLQQIPSLVSLKLNHDEQQIIRNKFYRENIKQRDSLSGDERLSAIGDIKLLPDTTIADLEESILRYRRLIRYPDIRIKRKLKEEASRVKQEAIQKARLRKLARELK